MSSHNIEPMRNISLTPNLHGTGPGILLAHGGGGSIESNFGGLIPVLARDHTVVAADYPAEDRPVRLDDLADALVASAVEAGVETFTLIGFSLGTAVAVRAATRHPDRVRGIVLAAGFARPDNRLRLAMGIWTDLIRGGRHEAFARFALGTAFSAAHIRAMKDDEVQAFITHFPVRAGAPAQAELIASVDTRADLARLPDVPVLVVTPTGDLLNDPANSRALAAGIRGAEHVELDAGHLLMAERPGEWAAAVTGFLVRRGL